MSRATFQTKPNEDGLPLVDVLSDRLRCSKKQARVLLDARQVFVNGKRVWMAKHTLKLKDVIETVRPEPKSHKIEILKRAGDLIVVNKPSGMVTNGSARSLEVRLQHELNNPQLCAVHRLDRDTSGCVLFAAKLVEDQPRFDPSPRWGEPIPVPPSREAGVRTAGVMDVPEFAPGEPEAYEDALGNVARFRGGVPELFSTQMPGMNMKGFDSLYVGPSGDVFMLTPHQHNETARSVLRAVHPDLPANLVQGRVAGGYSHTDLTRASGIQRIQIYRDGMGVTVEMANPPNRRQLDAIRDAYMMTPMDRFVAEINLNGETLAHLTSFGQLVHFVNNWDPDDPSSVEVLDPRLGALYDRKLVD